MSGGHTPGNWYANGSNVFVPVHGDNGPAIIIARFAGEGGETEANATVAAAAPDLLAALEGLTERLVKGDSIGFARIEAAVAAIAKARGEA